MTTNNNNDTQVTATTIQATARQFEMEITKLLDFCIEQTSIRDAFEHWHTPVLYGAIRLREDCLHISNDCIMAVAKEYRLKLENKVKRQTLNTLEELTLDENKEEAINYYNWHREYADYIALI